MRQPINSILFVLGLGASLPAAAQGRLPAGDSAAVGGEVGAFVATQESLGGAGGFTPDDVSLATGLKKHF